MIVTKFYSIEWENKWNKIKNYYFFNHCVFRQKHSHTHVKITLMDFVHFIFLVARPNWSWPHFVYMACCGARCPSHTYNANVQKTARLFLSIVSLISKYAKTVAKRMARNNLCILTHVPMDSQRCRSKTFAYKFIFQIFLQLAAVIASCNSWTYFRAINSHIDFSFLNWFQFGDDNPFNGFSWIQYPRYSSPLQKKKRNIKIFRTFFFYWICR